MASTRRVVGGGAGRGTVRGGAVVAPRVRAVGGGVDGMGLLDERSELLMGTVGEMLQASVPCSCGRGDVAYGDGYDVFGGRAVSVHCKSCGQTVRAADKQSVIAAWFEANRLALGEHGIVRATQEAGGESVHGIKTTLPVGDYTVNLALPDLARAAVLLRELADIVERAARVRP